MDFCNEDKTIFLQGVYPLSECSKKMGFPLSTPHNWKARGVATFIKRVGKGRGAFLSGIDVLILCCMMLFSKNGVRLKKININLICKYIKLYAQNVVENQKNIKSELYIYTDNKGETKATFNADETSICYFAVNLNNLLNILMCDILQYNQKD